MDCNGKQTIDIRPASSVYATYQRLSYKPWYALAEFVDNSTASFFCHKDELLRALEGRNPQLPSLCRVEINYDHEARRLIIRDDAFGMELEDFRRAIALDQPPHDRSGRNEFGMGLKTAACWFGSRWTIETTQLGSPRHYTATMDIHDLVLTRPEEIPYAVRMADPKAHGTTLTIENVHQPIVGRAHGRIKEQLRSMYRHDLRAGEVSILYQGEALAYEEPELLREQLDTGTKLWRQGLALSVPWEQTGKTLSVTGWVGVRKTISRRDSGFALMRRGRVIIGGPDHGYRPIEVCGAPQTHEYGRIVGELNLDDWPVNQAKDGFNWNDGLEEAFVRVLEEACREVTRKARTHRVIVDQLRPPSPVQMNAAAEPIRHAITSAPFRQYAAEELADRSNRRLPSEIKSKQAQTSLAPSDVQAVKEPCAKPSAGTNMVHKAQPIEFLLDTGSEQWLLLLHWHESLPDQYWMSIQPPRSSLPPEQPGAQVVEITLNTAHPFLAPYLHSQSSLDVMQRLVFALALSETMVRLQSSGGRVEAGAIRSKMNEVLRHAANAERGH